MFFLLFFFNENENYTEIGWKQPEDSTWSHLQQGRVQSLLWGCGPIPSIHPTCWPEGKESKMYVQVVFIL